MDELDVLGSDFNIFSWLLIYLLFWFAEVGKFLIFYFLF